MKYKVIGKNEKKDFLREVFENRDIPIDNIEKYLHTSDQDIYDFNLLDNINEAAQVYIEHLKAKSKILLVVDPDVDGITSSALFYNFTKEVDSGADISFVMHEGKQHGLSDDLDVDFSKFDFIVIPDAGSNDFLQHEVLSADATVLVLDHHNVDDGYSEHAIVVNNQLSENYPNKELSGVGVVWQFCRAVNENYKLGIDIDKYLDIVALGLVADMQDLRSIETKHLVMKGLENINNSMLKAFCEAQSYSLGNKVTPDGLAWYIAPSLNSVVRVGTQENKRMLFKAFLNDYAEKDVPSSKRGKKDGDTEVFCEQAIRISKNVRTEQNKIVDAALTEIVKIIEDKKLYDNKVLIVEIKDIALPAETVGLVANKLASMYELPTLLVREFIEKDENGEIIKSNLSGSGRNIEHSPLEDFRELLNKSEMVNFAQGHASAFGTLFPKENKQLLLDYLNNYLSQVETEPCARVDFEFDCMKEQKLLEKCIIEIGTMTRDGCWGKGVKEPIIAITNIPVSSNINLMGAKKNTLKIVVGKIDFMKFFAKETEYNSLSSSFGQNNITVIGKCSLNEYGGRTTPQIFINDYEIETTQKYIF